MEKEIKEYLTALESRKYSISSIAAYERAFNRFADFLKTKNISRFQDVTYRNLEDYRLHLLDRGFADASIYLFLRSVRMLFAYLEETQQIFVNPARHLVIPAYDRGLKPVPSETEMEKVLLQADTSTPIGIRDRAVLETAYSCGLRRDELCQLTIFDPANQQSVLHVMGKGKKERVLPVGKKAVFWLKQYLEKTRPLLRKKHDENALWISRTGKRISYSSIDKLIRHYGKKAGLEIPLSTHSLRRACATHMLSGGAHPVKIQMLLGHSDLKTLSQYLKITVNDMIKMHQRSKPGK